MLKRQAAPQKMAKGLSDGQDPLRAGLPTRADPVAGYAPYLLCVRFKERPIEFRSKAADKELLQVFDLTGRKQRIVYVTGCDPDGTHYPEFSDGIPVELDGIIKESSQEINPGLAIPEQHFSPAATGTVALDTLSSCLGSA
jgi:hypothetical protein